jgi:hypothetical protein
MPRRRVRPGTSQLRPQHLERGRRRQQVPARHERQADEHRREGTVPATTTWDQHLSVLRQL